MIETLTEKARAAIGRTPRSTQRAFRMKFAESRDTDIVLAWFADLCGATESIADSDPLVMAVAEGRRQVWLALQDILRVSERDIREAQERVSLMEGEQ